ncbi:MAG TPA: hypothetical protein VFP34_06345 [Microlunatus sp.]|nr:hypothetical protein [Microlunatus sp.]
MSERVARADRSPRGRRADTGLDAWPDTGLDARADTGLDARADTVPGAGVRVFLRGCWRPVEECGIVGIAGGQGN